MHIQIFTHTILSIHIYFFLLIHAYLYQTNEFVLRKSSNEIFEPIGHHHIRNIPTANAKKTTVYKYFISILYECTVYREVWRFAMFMVRIQIDPFT